MVPAVFPDNVDPTVIPFSDNSIIIANNDSMC